MNVQGDFVVGGRVFQRLPHLIQIDGYSCGAVAGAMVVRTFYPEVKFKEFYNAVNPYPDGVSTSHLIRTLRAFNVGCRVMRALSFNAFREAIDDGFPSSPISCAAPMRIIGW